MTKQEFLAGLEKELSGLPQEDIAERLAFYGEMIEDRKEDGLSEEEAVEGIGSAEAIAKQIIDEIPLSKLVRERVKSQRRMRAWEIILLILGSPVWLSLLIAAFAVVFSVFVAIWAVIVSLWAADLAFAVCAVGGVAIGIFQICKGNVLPGVGAIGASVALAGLAILFFYGCKAITKGGAFLTKKTILGIKSLFIRKENK